MKLSIVIPVFNEAENLPALLDRLNATAQEISARYQMSVDYVFIDDGSRDGSFEVLTGLDFAGHGTRLLQFSRNFGKEAALSAGIDAAIEADAVVLMDADLQHPPELILDFIRVWQREKVDTVYGRKESRRASEGIPKAVLTRAFYWVINHGARFRMSENAGDFRLVSRRFADALRQLPESQRFMKGLYGWVGFSEYAVPLDPPPRQRGHSNFGALNLLRMSFDAITSFTTAPLRLMALAGLMIAVMSSLYGSYIVVERLFFAANGHGTASILALIAFFGGVQMIFLGLLGEYIGKTVLEAKRRPSYILAENRVLAPKVVTARRDTSSVGKAEPANALEA